MAIGLAGCPDVRIATLHGLVRELARAGRFEAAEQVTVTITDPGVQTRVFGELVQVLAGAGDALRAARVAELAEKVAATIPDPETHAWALNALASSLSNAMINNQAARIAARATGFGRWYAALQSVASLDPDAVLDAADTIPGERISRR